MSCRQRFRTHPADRSLPRERLSVATGCAHSAATIQSKRSPITGGLPRGAYFTFLVFTDCAITVVFVRALVVMVHLPFDSRIVHW